MLATPRCRRVVELQAPYRACKEIRNTLQTSALSLDDSGLAIGHRLGSQSLGAPGREHSVSLAL
jgi:hypothetical protein